MRGGNRRTLLAVALVLGICLAVGLALRATALAAWWPIATTLGDSGPYAYFASGVNPLTNPQHPPGYSVFLALVGVVTRDVAAVGILQHLLAIAAALTLAAAVWRLCGSPWPGVVGAAVILLGADQVYLEHTILSEAFYTFMLAISVYAVARALELPERWWPWPVIAALLVVAAGMTRSAGLFLIPVVALAIVLARPRPWVARWRPILAFVGTATALLLTYALANHASNDRFEVAPTGGWHLYGRVAPFADCGQFTPPAGTRGLCERTDPAKRMGTDWYLYEPDSPAKAVFGPRPFEHDDKLGAFGRRAVWGQPRTYALAVWNDVSAYFVPGSFDWAPGRGSDLDGQLDWTGPIYPKTEREIEEGLETYFFDDFAVDRDPGALGFLHDYQRVARFGATALTIAALLILIGLFVGSRRRRVAVLLLGAGGLATVVLPTLSVIYIARYTVPPAPLIAAGAAVATMSVAQAAAAALRRRRGRGDLDVGTLFPSLADELGEHASALRGEVLNAGAGDRDLRSLVPGRVHNQDIPEGLHNDGIDILSPLHEIPVEDGFFDAIFCNAVLEHVANPEEVMAEFARVCKPEGVLYLCVPFMQPEHLDPTDFQRYTIDGLKLLVERHGFEVQRAEGMHNVYITLGWIAREWLTASDRLRYRVARRCVFPWLARRAKTSNLHVHALASAYRVVATRR